MAVVERQWRPLGSGSGARCAGGQQALRTPPGQGAAQESSRRAGGRRRRQRRASAEVGVEPGETRAGAAARRSSPALRGASSHASASTAAILGIRGAPGVPQRQRRRNGATRRPAAGRCIDDGRGRSDVRRRQPVALDAAGQFESAASAAPAMPPDVQRDQQRRRRARRSLAQHARRCRGEQQRVADARYAPLRNPIREAGEQRATEHALAIDWADDGRGRRPVDRRLSRGRHAWRQPHDGRCGSARRRNAASRSDAVVTRRPAVARRGHRSAARSRHGGRMPASRPRSKPRQPRRGPAAAAAARPTARRVRLVDGAKPHEQRQRALERCGGGRLEPVERRRGSAPQASDVEQRRRPDRRARSPARAMRPQPVARVPEPSTSPAPAARRGPPADRPSPRRCARSQAVDAARGIVARDLLQAGVDDGAHAGHGERRFGDIGREDDAPSRGARPQRRVLPGGVSEPCSGTTSTPSGAASRGSARRPPRQSRAAREESRGRCRRARGSTRSTAAAAASSPGA